MFVALGDIGVDGRRVDDAFDDGFGRFFGVERDLPLELVEAAFDRGKQVPDTKRDGRVLRIDLVLRSIRAPGTRREEHDDEPDDDDGPRYLSPTTIHHRVASILLKRGVHCLIEKPVTSTLEEFFEKNSIPDQSIFFNFHLLHHLTFEQRRADFLAHCLANPAADSSNIASR